MAMRLKKLQGKITTFFRVFQKNYSYMNFNILSYTELKRISVDENLKYLIKK